MKKGFININLTKLCDNYLHYRNNSDKKVIAVVKDNAYGHGLTEVAKALESKGCDFFIVSSISEALSLRKYGITGGILLLGYPESDEYELLSNNNISIALYSLQQLKEITDSYFQVPLKLHIKINSGMQRNGINPDKIIDVVNRVRSDSRLIIEGIFTHYIGGSKCLDFVRGQFDLFGSAIKKINHDNLMIHASSTNSFNLLDDKITNYIRVGLGLYGLSDNHNNPILELKAPIVQIYKVSKGTICGYDGVFTTNEDGYIYTLPIGYADGFKPLLNHVAYKDGYLIQSGKVSMDYCNFFSTKLYNESDEIELIGPNIKAEDIAKKANTIKYDIVSSLSHKLKRNYIS